MENTQETVQDLADRLIKLKLDVDEKMAEITMIKTRIKPFVKMTPVKTSDGTVRYVDGNTSVYLNKEKLRDVLMSTFKLSEQAANRIIAMGGAKKIVDSYVKVTTG